MYIINYNKQIIITYFTNLSIINILGFTQPWESVIHSEDYLDLPSHVIFQYEWFATYMMTVAQLR